MKPILLGEAPARSGDGRPFTGHAGDRLIRLLELNSYDQLEQCFELRNLFDNYAEAHARKGDKFDLATAREHAYSFATREVRPEQQVIAMGKRVWRAFKLPKEALWYNWSVLPYRPVAIIWLFPHPSGVSTYWNDPISRELAADFLRERLIALGIDLKAIRSQRIPPF